MFHALRPALSLLCLFTVLTGGVYPLVVTGLGQLLFPREAGGSLIKSNGHVVGSSLIGQSFRDPKYFWPRPSATPTVAYNAAASSGSNLGPISPALLEAFTSRSENLRSQSAEEPGLVPVDLITASGSGLDPHISPAGALHQVARIAQARGIAPAAIRTFLARYIQPRTLKIFGEPRVNVLELNLALDNND